MPKIRVEFPEQINVLCRRGVTANLRAISYYRGEAGRYAPVAKEFLQVGIERWIESLAPSERRRFESILETVKATDSLVETEGG